MTPSDQCFGVTGAKSRFKATGRRERHRRCFKARAQKVKRNERNAALPGTRAFFTGGWGPPANPGFSLLMGGHLVVVEGLSTQAVGEAKSRPTRTDVRTHV